MTKRVINDKIEQLLVANEPFEYAHLVKFERPFAPKDGKFRTNARRYVYLTDASRDITFQGNTYIANRIKTVGNYAETTEARATNMNLTLSGEPLGVKFTTTGDLSSGAFAINSGQLVDGDLVDFVAAGFIEGDKVKITKSNGTSFSDGDTSKIFIISAFTNNNQNLTLERTGTDSDDSAFVTLNDALLTFELVSEELTGATLDLSGATPSFLNREVFIYKVFFRPDNPSVIVGKTGTRTTDTQESILIFKGIISSTNIQENPTSSVVQWNLTSHWGDFEQISGRITSDEIHRGLNSFGLPNPDASARPAHSTDLGFLHAETSLNTIANYQTSETRYKYKAKKRWYKSKVKIKEDPYEHVEDHEADVSIYLQGKYLPIAYGVNRLPPITVFADTSNTDSKEVYQIHALSEGEIHGIYNMYIDNVPLICVDKNDQDVRSAAAADSENQALICYGRMDQGNVIGGTTLSSTTAYASSSSDAAQSYSTDNPLTNLNGQATDANPSVWYNNHDHYSNANTYASTSEPASGTNTLTGAVGDNAKGLQHETTVSINTPFDMSFTFHAGREDQEANGQLVTKAQSNGFKRQNDYYTGSELYWSPNHRLLDTAYVQSKFTIAADQTSVPDVEYVVKGKVLECFNYDGTFLPNTIEGASDNASNFNEGDTVNVQVSSHDIYRSDQANYTTLQEGGSDKKFRIIDKYTFTTSRGTTYVRFRLDTVPDLTYVDGKPTVKNLRLKVPGANTYWHMATWNNDVVGTATAWPATNNIFDTSSISTNAQGQLQFVLSNTGESVLQAFFGTTNLNSTANTPIEIKFSGTGCTGTYANLRKATARATYDTSNNTLTVFNSKFDASQTLSNIDIHPATKVNITIANLSNTEGQDFVVGSKLRIVETGEERNITAYNNGYVTLAGAFITHPVSTNTYQIVGRFSDRRSSINPALQLADLLTHPLYGKDLSLDEDIDIGSIKSSALICDTRSDVSIAVNSCTVQKGDVYKLLNQANNKHIASGKVKETVTNGTTITFEEVSGKFMRAYYDYISYTAGDVVYHNINGVTYYYEATSNGYLNAPTALGGTGWSVISAGNLTLDKDTNYSDASSPNSITVNTSTGLLPAYSLYDSDFVKYWRYIGWEENRQWCVTRHQSNGVIDTSKSIFSNINSMLSHFNGILSYSNGKYVLGVETQADAPTEATSHTAEGSAVAYDWNVNPEYIDETDIIGRISLNDNSQKNSKNTVKGSIFDPQNNFNSRSISFFNSEFLEADRNVIKSGNLNLPGITSYYNARITIEKFLKESRFSKEISFTVGPKGILLKPGEVISVNYEPFGFVNKRFRISNLTYSSNCNVTVKAKEYDDSFYVISSQRATKAKASTTSVSNTAGIAPSAPTSLSATDGSNNPKPGVIGVSWNNATDYHEESDFTEVWRASSQSGNTSTAITTHATLHAIIDNAESFNDSVGEAGEFYYWVRHIRRFRRVADNSMQQVSSDFHPANSNIGESGTAFAASPALEVDVSSISVTFDSDGNFSPANNGGQDVVIKTTVRNINDTTINYKVVEANGTSLASGNFFTSPSTGNSITASVSGGEATATFRPTGFTSTTTKRFIRIEATDSVSNETFTRLVPISVLSDGSSGGVGVDAAAIDLQPSKNVVSYSAQNSSSDPDITFTALTQGTSDFSGTPNLKFFYNGSLVTGIGTGGTIALSAFTSAVLNTSGTNPLGAKPAAGTSVSIKVSLFDGTTEKASDTVTIFGVKDGSDSITTFLSNSAHVVPTSTTGTVPNTLINNGFIKRFAAASNEVMGEFKVFVGAQDKTSECNFVVESESGCDASIDAGPLNKDATPVATAGQYKISSSNFSDLGSARFKVTIFQDVSPTGSDILISRDFSIAKSKAGATGADANTIRLSATSQIFKVLKDGTTDPASITLTADKSNVSGTTSFSTTPSVTLTGSGDTRTLTSGNFGNNQSVKVTASAVEDSTTFTDEITVVRVEEGTDSITGILGNESHTFTAANDGTVSDFSNGTTTIRVFEGATALTYKTSSPGNGEFTVTKSASGITQGAVSGFGGNNTTTCTTSAPTAMSADEATITYTITGKKANGTSFTSFTKVQSFSKSKTGGTGSSAFVARIYLQRDLSDGASAPTPPSGGSYNFSTDTLTAPTGWQVAEPAFSFGQIIYKSEKVVVGSGTVNITFPQGVVHNPFFDNTKLIFKRSATNPAPNADSLASSLTVPNTFFETPPTGTDPLWQVTGTFLYTGTDAYKYDWSAAVQITGDAAYNGVLLKDNLGLSSKSDGTGYDLSLANNTFKINKGGVDDTANWTFKVNGEASSSGNNSTKAQNGLTISINRAGSGGTRGAISFSGGSWTSDSETFTLVASQSGLSDISKELTLFKIKGSGDKRSALVTIFNPSSALTGVTEPTDTTSGTPYNFETGVLTIGSGGTSGWTSTRPAKPYWTSIVQIAETTAGSTQSVDYGTPRRTGTIGIKDRLHLTNDVDTSTQLPVAQGGTGATNLDALQNSRVKINADGTLSYNNTSTGALNLDTISGVTDFVDRVSDGLDASGNLIGNIGTGGNQRTIAEIAGAIDNSGNIVPGKVPLNASFLEVDSNQIKIKNNAIGATQLAGSIAYTGTITAGTGTTVAGLVGSGTDADSTVRIFAGQSLGSRNQAPFRVTQGGEVNVTSININTDDGNNHKSVLLKPDHVGGVIFAVGDKANPTGAPMRAVATGSGASAETTIELQNVKIFKNDGTTLMFDSDGGFTDAAYTDIAANVGTSSAGSTVQTVEVTNLVNPFASIDETISSGEFYTDNENVITGGTIPTGKKISQKITLFGTTTLNFTITKSASMTGADSNSTTANNEVPDKVQMRLMHSTASNLRNATEIAKFGSSFSAGFSKIQSGTANSNQYRTNEVTETEPGFSFTLVTTLDEGAAAGGTFTATGSGNFSGSTSGTDHYFFLEVTGNDNGTPTSGANSVAFDASRTLRITTTSGAFVVDDDGGVQPSGNDPDVIGVTAGNLIDVTDTANNTNAQSIRVDVDLSELNQSTSNADGDEFVVLDSSGNEKRLVKGNINLSGFNNDLTSFGSGISVTGAIQATGDVVAFHSSDYRLKNNITTIENALDKVDEMRGVEFDWNEKQDSWEGHDIGVIAQEVEKVIPEIVIERDDGYKAVSYHKLTALLIQAVKELKEEIKELKKDK